MDKRKKPFPTRLLNKQWIYSKQPESEVSSEHYRLLETALDPKDLKDNEVLLQAKYISVDPYMRIQQARHDTWTVPHPLGEVQGSGVVAEVIESKDMTGRIKKGDMVNGYLGWQLYAACPAGNVRKIDPGLAPVSTALGVLGMPGLTAYFGLLSAGKPKPGETVLVSGAAGAVGSIVVQIAKLKGCRVVAIAGSPEKCGYLKQELGADAVVDYKEHRTTEAMTEALKAAAPDGIDVYFDNVGGRITDAVFPLINLRARIVICGQISQYNGGLDQPEPGPRFLHHILYKRAAIQGILARDFNDRLPEMLAEMGPWVRDGKIKFKETIIEGFDNLPQALNSLFHGANTGKMLVKI